MALFGPDVSSAQRGIDTGSLPGDFVIVKVTGGTNYVNPYADAQIQSAKAKGKRTAIYHYVGDYNPGTAAQEAAWFLQNSAGYLDGTNVVIMDWEAGGNPNVGNPAYAQEFVNAVRNASGIQPVGYADMAHVQYLIPAYNAGMPVWVAAYTLGYQRIDGYNVPQGPIGNLYGIAPVMWQFTSSGYLPGWGGGLDLNIFYSDGAAWDALAAKNGTITPQGYTPQEDELSQSEVLQIQGFLNTLQNEIQKSCGEVTQQLIKDQVAGIPKAVMEYPVPNAATGKSTTLGAMVGWNDSHVNALIDAITSRNPSAVAAAIPADIAKAVADELAKRLASKAP